MPDRLSIGLGRRLRIDQRPSLIGPVQAVSFLLDLLATWERRARERRKLAEMSDHMLRDLGISRNAALRESRKSIWRA